MVGAPPIGCRPPPCAIIGRTSPPHVSAEIQELERNGHAGARRNSVYLKAETPVISRPTMSD